jgi:hypothetical protein
MSKNMWSVLATIGSRIANKVRILPIIAGVVGTLLYWLLYLKVAHYVHDLTGMVPSPPPPIPLHEDATPETSPLPEIVLFLALGIYLVFHFWTAQYTRRRMFRSILIAVGLSLLAWGLYYFVIFPWLTCDYHGRFTVGFYYTRHGREYAQEHECHEVIRDHASELSSVWTQASINLASGILAFFYFLVILIFFLTVFLILETLVRLVLPGAHHAHDP